MIHVLTVIRIAVPPVVSITATSCSIQMTPNRFQMSGFLMTVVS